MITAKDYKEQEKEYNKQILSTMNNIVIVQLFGENLTMHLKHVEELRETLSTFMEMMNLPSREFVSEITLHWVQQEDRIDNLEMNLMDLDIKVQQMKSSLGNHVQTLIDLRDMLKGESLYQELSLELKVNRLKDNLQQLKLLF